MAYAIIKRSFETGGKLLIAGNGGSLSDADHIVGELMKGFVLPRKVDESVYDVRRLFFRAGNVIV